MYRDPFWVHLVALWVCFAASWVHLEHYENHVIAYSKVHLTLDAAAVADMVEFVVDTDVKVPWRCVWTHLACA